LEDVTRGLLQGVLAQGATGFAALLQDAGQTGVAGSETIEQIAKKVATFFGPSHFETRCGFKVDGALVSSVHCEGVPAEVLPGNQLVRLSLDGTKRAVNVLIELADGRGVVLPALDEFITTLTFDDDELANVSYEPSDNTWRWQDYVGRADEVRALRATVASAAKLGVFRLEGVDSAELARRMRLVKGIDPTMGLYAAYAYNDLRRRDEVKSIRQYLSDDLGVVFFDNAMLAGTLDGQLAGRDSSVR
jgi:hypothetical protein